MIYDGQKFSKGVYKSFLKIMIIIRVKIEPKSMIN